ncbi:MAG: DUF1848 domain-containing protein [Lentisphaerae bacterium]|nr:DUF1848 domain-containing protein [Lentisphaerota bacterium]
MIISASRRTDIPAFYAEWLLRRLRAGYAETVNPFRPSQVTRVNLTPEHVDGLVLWSKNPAPLLPFLPELIAFGIPFYLQFTVTPYDAALEPGVPPKSRVIDTFLRLSDQLGPQRLVWRYDPIIVTEAMTPSWHCEHFAALCAQLAPSCCRCVISFVDPYRNSPQAQLAPDAADMHAIAAGFAPIAASWRLPLFTCAEPIDLSSYGIAHGACIDSDLLGTLAGRKLHIPRDRHQRPDCGCAKSIDLGRYGTCRHGCTYCYATGRRPPRPMDGDLIQPVAPQA